MNLADVADVAPATSNGPSVLLLACAALACLFAVSAVALVVVMRRRSRKNRPLD